MTKEQREGIMYQQVQQGQKCALCSNTTAMGFTLKYSNTVRAFICMECERQGF